MKFKILFLYLSLLIGNTVIARINKHLLDSVYVSVSVEGSKMDDTLLLMYFKTPINNVPSPNGSYRKIYSSLGKDKKFKFVFPITNTTGYFFLGKKIRKNDSSVSHSISFVQISRLFLPDKGDSIDVRIKKDNALGNQMPYNIDFSGRGWFKYYLRDFLVSLKFRKSIHSPLPHTDLFTNDGSYNKGNSELRYLNKKLLYLARYKNKLPKRQFEVLKADIVFSIYPSLESSVYWYYTRKLENGDSVSAKSFAKSYKEIFDNIQTYHISEESLYTSIQFSRYVLTKIFKCDLPLKNYDKDAAFNQLRFLSYSPKLRDKLLLSYFLYPDITNPDYSKLHETISTVKSVECKQLLYNMNKDYEKSLFDFSLTDLNGKYFSLSNLKNKLVLVDFWFTGCLACSNYYSNVLSNIEKQYRNDTSIVFLSVCIDQEGNSWKKSLSKNIYSSTDNSNIINLFTGQDGSHDDFLKKFNISMFPTILLFDKGGKILCSDQNILSKKESALKIIADSIVR